MSAVAEKTRTSFLELLSARRRPLILGVVNATPDSFFAGSRKPGAEAAIEHGLRLAEEGADALDVGGQSTRPGADSVNCDDELSRVLPVIEELARRTSLPISIDTDKAEVARRAREAGATVLNDVSAFRRDPFMLSEAVKYEACIIMHIGGSGDPKTMQEAPIYSDVVNEVKEFLAERKAEYLRAGGSAARLLLDPGIGFGKTLEHNLALLKHLSQFSALGPVVLGASRKSFIGKILPDAGPEDRLEGSLAAACWAASAGAAVVRVHDALATRRALEVYAAIGMVR